MSKSLKVNYIYCLINTLTGVLFPLITFPYASRILEADGIGEIGFFSSIIGYISLFTGIGIPIYAIREIAKTRDDVAIMSRTAVEILLLHTIMVIIGYVFVAILCVLISKTLIDIPLFLILSISIFFSAIGCEWFYKGIEEFKYIAIRGIIVRVVFVILLFTLVHNKADILIYAGLTVLGNVGNNVFNFVRLWKYIKPQYLQIKDLNIFRHFIPSLRIFVLNCVISLYINLDTVMIGFIKDNYAVGYYEGASKIARLVVAVIQALQTALIPRFSYFAKKNDMAAFHELCQKVVDFVVTICLPLTAGLIVMAPTLIHLFCGPTYTPAILTLEVISPIVVMISLSGIACFQILYPLGKEMLAIWSTATGALVNLIICFLLIPKYAHNGAAVAVLFGEITVTFTMFFYGRKYICIKYLSMHYLNCLIGSLLMFVVLVVIRRAHYDDILNLFIIPTIGILVYSIYLYLRKDSFGMYIIEMINNKIHRS